MTLYGRNRHLKADATAVFERAIRRGIVTKGAACERCAHPRGDWSGDRMNAHHADYARPLDVEWLCTACHAKAHKVGPIEAPGGVRESLPREEQDAMMVAAKERRELLNERKPQVWRYGSARWLATGGPSAKWLREVAS